MTTKHTPGEWTLTEHLPKLVDGEITYHRFTIDAENGLPLAEFKGYREIEANARLFYASPALLAACKGIIANFHESVTTDLALAEFPALKAVADAIAEAESAVPTASRDGADMIVEVKADPSGWFEANCWRCEAEGKLPTDGDSINCGIVAPNKMFSAKDLRVYRMCDWCAARHARSGMVNVTGMHIRQVVHVAGGMMTGEISFEATSDIRDFTSPKRWWQFWRKKPIILAYGVTGL